MHYMSFDDCVTTRIIFGMGKFDELGSFKMPGKKALLISTDLGPTDFIERCIRQLTEAGIEVVDFGKVARDPVNTKVMEAAAMARENNCDFVVALGGGCCMDTAKAAAIMATNPGDLWDYMELGTGGRKPIEVLPLPIVTIPSTAGTGSEVDPWGAIVKEETNEKISIGNDLTRPVLSIVDPQLTMSLPKKFAAYQGFDSMMHAVERYCSRQANYLSDLYATTAIKLISENLVAAVEDGSNADAKEKVALGNNFAGKAMNICGGLSEHPLENSLTAYHPALIHGLGLMMICEAYYTKLAMLHSCDDRMIELAKIMGNENANDPMDFVKALHDLKEACNVPIPDMSEYDVTPDEFPKFIKNARETYGGPFERDRIRLTDEDLIWIYEHSTVLCSKDK